jgi:3-isopropylmalate dehydrogenase
MLLDWLGRRHREEAEVRAAAAIAAAVDRVIAERRDLTPDLGGRASTSGMGDAIAAALG